MIGVASVSGQKWASFLLLTSMCDYYDFFFFDRMVSVICIEELTDRDFIFNETWVIFEKSVFIQ